MTPEEFERLKNEEKAHLRQLRALKSQHRDAQRKVSSMGALQQMHDALRATEETGAQADALMRDAALQEARFDLAAESAQAAAASAAQTEADRETLRQAEAAALVARMKASLGEPAPAADAPPPASAVPGPPKTIGRPPPAPEAPTGTAGGDKTIGRPAGPSGPGSSQPG